MVSQKLAAGSLDGIYGRDTYSLEFTLSLFPVSFSCFFLCQIQSSTLSRVWIALSILRRIDSVWRSIELGASSCGVDEERVRC
jgi:hypothetical protein